MSFTPAIRSKITTAVHRDGAWRGRRYGILCEVVLDREAEPGHQFKWGFCLSHKWTRGDAGTVFDALVSIQARRTDV